MLRAIREIQPSYVVGENVRGFTNWNGGMVFDQVQADLEAEGYEVLPFLLPACAVNAPHRRDRIWIVAHRTGKGLEGRAKRKEGGVQFAERSKQTTENTNQDGRGSVKREEEPKERGLWDVGAGDNERLRADNEDVGTTANAGLLGSPEHEKQATGIEQCNKGDAPDTGIGQQGQRRPERPGSPEAFRNWKASWSYNDGRWPTQPPIRQRNDGLSPELSGITVSRHRKESIMAYGNAIVPQVAFEIFKAIEHIEQ